jgi:hypothetical protein
MILFLTRKGAGVHPVTDTHGRPHAASGKRGTGRHSRLFDRQFVASTHLAKASFAGIPQALLVRTEIDGPNVWTGIQGRDRTDAGDFLQRPVPDLPFYAKRCAERARPCAAQGT